MELLWFSLFDDLVEVSSFDFGGVIQYSPVFIIEKSIQDNNNMFARARASSSSWNVSSPYFFLCCLTYLIFIIVAPSLASSRYTVVGNNDYMTMNTVDSTKLLPTRSTRTSKWRATTDSSTCFRVRATEHGITIGSFPR